MAATVTIRGDARGARGATEDAARALDRLEASGKRAGDKLDGMGRAGVKMRGILGTISPELAGVAGLVDDVADGMEGAKLAAGSLGLSLSSVLAVLGPIALAVGGLALAWREVSQDAKAAEAASEAAVEANEKAAQNLASLSQRRKLAAAEAAAAEGRMTAAELAGVKARTQAEGEYADEVARVAGELAKAEERFGGLLQQMVDAGGATPALQAELQAAEQAWEDATEAVSLTSREIVEYAADLTAAATATTKHRTATRELRAAQKELAVEFKSTPLADIEVEDYLDMAGAFEAAEAAMAAAVAPATEVDERLAGWTASADETASAMERIADTLRGIGTGAVIALQVAASPESSLGAIPGWVGAVLQALQALGKTTPEAIYTAFEDLHQSVGRAISDVLPQVLANAGEQIPRHLTEAINHITANIDEIVAGLMEGILAAAEGIVTTLLPELLQALYEIPIAIVLGLAEYFTKRGTLTGVDEGATFTGTTTGPFGFQREVESSGGGGVEAKSATRAYSRAVAAELRPAVRALVEAGHVIARRPVVTGDPIHEMERSARIGRVRLLPGPLARP